MIRQVVRVNLSGGLLATVMLAALPGWAAESAPESTRLIDAGRFVEALGLLESPASTADASPGVRIQLARAYVGSGRYQEAETLLARIEPADAMVLTLRARVAEVRGRLDEAIELMARSVEAQQKSLVSTETVEGASVLAESRTRLGELAFRAGRLDLAKDQFQKAIALVNAAHAKLHELGIPHDEADPRMFAAGATAGLARVYAAKGDQPRAERTWRGVAARSDDPATVAELAAHALARPVPDARAARRHLDRALRLSEAKPAYRRTRALILAESRETLDQALTLAEAAYRDGPSVEARDTFAWVLHRRGENARAAEILAPALELGVRDPLVLYHAGTIASSLGKNDEARRLLSLALEINPSFDPLAARTARQTLAQLP